MFTQEDLQTLLAFDADNNKVVSLYMNADTGQQSRETVKMHVRGMLREVPSHLDSDVSMIENYFDLTHDWSKPGLALFSCAAKDFFLAYPAAIAFRNRLRISSKPYVKPLAHLLDHYAHYGVIVVDRVGARFFEFHLGELQEVGGTMGEDVRKLKRGSGSSAMGMRGGKGRDRSEEEVAQRNLREAAAAANQFFANKDIRRLFIGGTAENVAQFREELPKRLLSCLAGTFPIDTSASEGEVRARSLALLQQANAEREKKLVETMITTAAKGGNASLGLEDTLRAVSDGRVQTLILSDGYRVPGYKHKSTGYITTMPNSEFSLDDEMTPVEDAIEEAAARTLERGGQVEVIAENTDLDQAGRIGALLRY